VLLFGETQSRVLVSLPAANLDELRQIADSERVECTVLGKVGGNALRIEVDGVGAVDLLLQELEQAWRSSIRRVMEGG